MEKLPWLVVVATCFAGTHSTREQQCPSMQITGNNYTRAKGCRWVKIMWQSLPIILPTNFWKTIKYSRNTITWYSVKEKILWKYIIIILNFATLVNILTALCLEILSPLDCIHTIVHLANELFFSTEKEKMTPTMSRANYVKLNTDWECSI